MVPDRVPERPLVIHFVDLNVSVSPLANEMDISDRIQVALWIAAALAVAFYGNGRTDLISLVRHSPHLNR